MSNPSGRLVGGSRDDRRPDWTGQLLQRVKGECGCQIQRLRERAERLRPERIGYAQGMETNEGQEDKSLLLGETKNEGQDGSQGSETRATTCLEVGRES
jgi:hypothetical protein